MAKPATKKRKTALQKHLSKLGTKGGAATLKKHGREHYQRMADARWKPKK